MESQPGSGLLPSTYIHTHVRAYIHTYTILSGRRFFSFMTGDGHGNEDGDNPTHMLPRVTCSARQRFAGLNTNADRSVDADVDFVTIQNLLASIARICQTGGTGFAPTCQVTVRKHPLILNRACACGTHSLASVLRRGPDTSYLACT